MLGLDRSTTAGSGLTTMTTPMSGPQPGLSLPDETRTSVGVRHAFEAKLGVGGLGVNARRADGEIWSTFPIAVRMASRP